MLWLILWLFWSIYSSVNFRIYENISKIAIVHGDDFTVGYLLDYPYFKKTLNGQLWIR